MSQITLQRVSELLRIVFELLWDKPDGLPAKDVFALIPDLTKLTEYELGFAPSTNTPRYERIIRLATIPLVKVGWLVKNNRGRWHVTEEGRQACRKFTNVQELYREALQLNEDHRQIIPDFVITVETAEEKAWEQIQKYLQEKNLPDIRTMIAALLQALEYYIAWVAPAEKNRGHIDIIARADPIGAKGSRILVQIKHKGQVLTVEGLKAFLSVLGQNDYGLLVSTSGFTEDAKAVLQTQAFQKVTALDLETFFDLWIDHYDKLSQDARNLIPLRLIYFLSPLDS
jgi:restriction system protein